MSAPRSEGRRSPTTQSSAAGNLLHGGEEFGIAFVADKAGDDDDHRCCVVATEFGADFRARLRTGAETGGVATVADRDGVAGDPEAAGVGGLFGGDGHSEVGEASAEPFHGQAEGAAGDGPGLVEQKAVAGVGDARGRRRCGRRGGR